MMKNRRQGISQTVLVLHQGGNIVALPTQVVASVSAADSFSFEVSTQVAQSVALHYQTILAPFAEELAQALGAGDISVAIEFLPLEAFELLGVDSLVQGHSADLSVLVAIVAAIAGLAPREDVLLTGSLQSAAGHIGSVRNLSDKIAAFERYERFATVLCPKLDRDGSVEKLLPEHLVHERVARKSDQSIVEVGHIHELWEYVFVPASVIDWCFSRSEVVLPEWLEPLMSFGRSRFWPHFCELLERSEIASANRLLSLRQIDDPNFAGEFTHALENAPLFVKRLVSLDELIPQSWIRTVDASQLLAWQTAISCEHSDASLDARECFELLLDRLNETHLCATLDAPIDDAAASFVYNWERSGSAGAFWNEIQRFLAHLAYYRTGSHLPSSAFEQDAVAMVDALGGADMIIEQAQRTGISGMRQILEGICEEQKRTARQSYCRFLFVRLTQGTGIEQRMKLAELLISHFESVLPDDVLAEPSARYAKKFDELLLAIISQQTIFHRQFSAK